MTKQCHFLPTTFAGGTCRHAFLSLIVPQLTVSVIPDARLSLMEVRRPTEFNDLMVVILFLGILTDRSKEYRGNAEWAQNEDVRLNPESIAKVSLTFLMLMHPIEVRALSSVVSLSCKPRSLRLDLGARFTSRAREMVNCSERKY